jgi:hypothetical protein
MKHFMIDLETMGTRPYSIIASIGVVQFNLLTGELGAEFHKTIDRRSCLDVGLTEDRETIEWWKNQSKEVRDQLYKYNVYLPYALKQLKVWLTKYSTNGDFYVWGNSAAFDLGLITQACEKCNLPVPWKYWQECCCRTIVMLNPTIKEKTIKPKGAHHPIIDCKFQIDYIVRTLRSIKQKAWDEGAESVESEVDALGRFYIRPMNEYEK